VRQVIIMKGLPGSGKTTVAKQIMLQAPTGTYKRINKDNLRSMLDGNIWSGSNEGFVLKCRNTLLRLALEKGHSVIVDDTNLNPIHIESIQGIVQEWNNTHGAEDPVEVVIEDLTHVDLEECVKNDLKRENSVGRDVIEQMYYRYLYVPVKPVFDNDLPAAIICDLDGTLADNSWRNPVDSTECDKDPIIEPVAELLRAIKHRYEIMHPRETLRIIFMSGRQIMNQPQTKVFLERAGFKSGKDYTLLMRTDGDMRRDSIVKLELYDEYVKGVYNVLYVLDDRHQVIRECWQKLNLFVIKVGPLYNF
jgi:predicted kinase